MLLIIDNNENISKYFTCENEFLNASTHSLAETLEKIKKYNRVTKIYFPLELKFKDKKRQHFEGLELLKHIRLTPELGSLQYAPILLGYTYPLETILRNPESTILCSPATHLFHLKSIQQVNSSKFFQSNEELTKDKLKPYILYTDTDEAKSEHDRRNELGALKLERELNGTSKSDIGLDLWQKKLIFLQAETIANQQTVSDADFKAIIKGKRILYLDDEADKWEKLLKQLFGGATLDIKSDYEDIVKYFEELQAEQDKLRSDYTEIDRQLLQKFFTSGKSPEFILQYSKDVLGVKSKLAAILNYDLILLDMRLEKAADSNKPINLISGVQVLNKIYDLNPFIPVVMFTASNKVESYKSVIDNGAYDFWIKNVSSANDLKNKSVNLLRNELQGKRLGNLKDVYAKLLMIESRVSIYNYSTNGDETLIETEAISESHRRRIEDSVWHFIKERFRWINRKKVYLSPTDINLSFEYINHTIDFLLDYR